MLFWAMKNEGWSTRRCDGACMVVLTEIWCACFWVLCSASGPEDGVQRHEGEDSKRPGLAGQWVGGYWCPQSGVRLSAVFAIAYDLGESLVIPFQLLG